MQTSASATTDAERILENNKNGRFIDMQDFFEGKCEVVRDILPIYADHGTSPETTALVAQHVAKCDACSKYLGYIRKSNARKKAEIKAEITPDYLNFLKALRRKRTARNAAIAAVLATSMAALVSAAFMRNSDGK